MTRTLSAIAFALLLPLSASHALDIPYVNLGFQLGFNVNVLPGPKDASHYLGLGVVTDRIITDKTRSLVVTGYITNYNDVPCEGVEMRFAVTSYVAAGMSLGWANVEPRTIPPGGSARFNMHVSLDSPRPKNALYTITARSPAVSIHPGSLQAAPAAVRAAPAADPADEYMTLEDLAPYESFATP